MSEILEDSKRNIITDKVFCDNVSGSNYSISLFQRVGAKNKKFKNINFYSSIFDSCYFRNCIFENCSFNGCKFLSCNLYQSKFSGCNFDYTTFDRTYIENHILDECCPNYENLKFKFARSLRVNYSQIGDVDSANKAIKVELSASKEHLYKAWKSNTAYYRSKYRGFERFKAFLDWIKFITFDFIWGNGESLLKLLRFVLLLLFLISIFDVFLFQDAQNITNYIKTFPHSFSIFFGTENLTRYNPTYIAIIRFIQLITFALFMSILIKKLNRR